MLKSVFGKFWPHRSHYLAIKSFSYFLPAPPKRNSGYQEKEFDQSIAYLSKLGFELIDFQMASHTESGQGGVWIVCRMGALTQEAANQDINVDYQVISGQMASEIPMDPDIVHER